jgi:hypothetical protein
MDSHVTATKTHRRDLDAVLQRLKRDSDKLYCGERPPDHPIRMSRERSLAVTKVQEAIMWLGMDLKAQHEEGVEGVENPYPHSYNPESSRIEPTADGLKL